LIAVAGLEGLYYWKVQPALRHARTVQAQFYKAYRDDWKALETSPLEQRKILNADAGPYLNPRVYWTPQIKDPGPVRGLAAPLVSFEIRDTVIRLKDEWLERHQRTRREKIDFSLFSEIERFDYWNIESSSPIETLASSARFVPPSRLPIPDPTDLIILATLRLMNGAELEKPLPALSETHKLAELMLTTENLQLVLAGIKVLELERMAYLYFIKKLHLPPSVWTPVDADFGPRAHREVLATRGYLRLWTDHQQLHDIFLASEKPPGFCAAINESMPLEFSLRPMLQPHWVFEVDWREPYTTLNDIFVAAKKTCRLNYLTSLMRADHFASRIPGSVVLNGLPYSRGVFGTRMSVSNFGGFDDYSRQSEGTSRR
jgi:hypothetical protein